MSEVLEARLRSLLRASPRTMHVLRSLRALDLPDWRVFSGAIYQTVWNAVTSRDPEHGVRDYDVGYFDASDLSYAAEDLVIQRVAAAFEAPLRELVQVRNQARVHLWFEPKFGEPYAPLRDTDESLARFVCPAFAVGVRLEADDTISIAAPFGLDDTFALRLRPNPTRPRSTAWARVTSSAKARWPEATIIS
jgi:hypothetical protein